MIRTFKLDNLQVYFPSDKPPSPRRTVRLVTRHVSPAASCPLLPQLPALPTHLPGGLLARFWRRGVSICTRGGECFFRCLYFWALESSVKRLWVVFCKDALTCTYTSNSESTDPTDIPLYGHDRHRSIRTSPLSAVPTDIIPRSP